MEKVESPVKVSGGKIKREKKLQPSWNEMVTRNEMILFPLRQMLQWILY